MSKIIQFTGSHRNNGAPRTCNFSAVSDKGNKVHGQAALKVIMKRAGGPDAFLQKIGMRAAAIAVEEIASESGGYQKSSF